MCFQGENYLIPADNAKEVARDDGTPPVKRSGAELEGHAVNAQRILDDIADRNPSVTIVFLDCCRTYCLQGDENDDLVPRHGVEGVKRPQGFRAMATNTGSLIAFACAPGTKADDGKGHRNGLFTKHLLKHIETPNEDIHQTLVSVINGVTEESNRDQIPHISSTLREKRIYLYEQSASK
jgi:uncharacterized caspase-like protein